MNKINSVNKLSALQFIARPYSLLPGLTAYCQALQFIARPYSLLPGLTVYCQALQFIARPYSLLPGLTVYCQALQFIARPYTRKCQSCLGPKKIHVNTDTRFNDNIDLHSLNAVHINISKLHSIKKEVIHY